MDPASARHQTKLLRRGFKKQGETKVASGPVDMTHVLKSMTKIILTLNHVYVRLDHFFTEDHLASLHEKNDLVMSSQLIGIVTLINALTETPPPKNIPATKQAAFDKKMVEFHSIFSRLLKSGYFLFERNQILQTSLKESGNNLLDWLTQKPLAHASRTGLTILRRSCQRTSIGEIRTGSRTSSPKGTCPPRKKRSVSFERVTLPNTSQSLGMESYREVVDHANSVGSKLFLFIYQ